jgi:hypothetical protein
MKVYDVSGIPLAVPPGDWKIIQRRLDDLGRALDRSLDLGLYLPPLPD